MALFITPVLLDDHYFDDMFDEVNREVARMQNDMRNAMLRHTPSDPLLAADNDKHLERLENIRGPFATVDGKKEFQLQFDVGTFKPDEIKVKTDNGKLTVEAEHEDETDNSHVYHHFRRHYTLPEGVSADTLTSTLSKDGILMVKGPCNPDNALEEPPAKKQALEQAEQE